MFALLLGSCATLRDFLGFGFHKPEISLRDVSLTGAGKNGFDLDVKLRITNRNDFGIVLEHFEYKLTSLKLMLATGQYEKRFEFKAQSRNDITLPLHVNTENLSKILTKILANPEAEHKAVLEATARFDSGIGKFEHSFYDEHKLTGLSF